MSVKGVCVDRGRIVRLEPAIARVEGRSTFEPIPEQWFRCRLSISESTRTSVPRNQAALNFRARLMMASLLVITVDLDSNPLEFRNDQRIDVSSLQLGRAIWRNEDEPQPIRKKKKVIGFMLSLERVLEREYDDLLQQNVPHPELNPIAQ